MACSSSRKKSNGRTHALPDSIKKIVGEHMFGGLAGMVTGASEVKGEISLDVAAMHIVHVLTFLRDDAQGCYTVLVDICGVDYPDRPARFEVVYHLLSMRKNTRIHVNFAAAES